MNSVDPASFSLLIKPSSADCNLRCRYCFYLDRSRLYPAQQVHRMGDTVLERVISSYLALPFATHAFGWQGGEPTLMGLEFFRKVTALQQRYGERGVVVSNGLQTNAVLIDDPFAEHLAQYRFLVGVSLDGPRQMHDSNRLRVDGSGSYDAVRRGIETLRRNQVDFNILTLVNSSNVAHAAQLYRFLRDEGFYYQQYIPCVEYDSTGKLLPFAIQGEQWGAFLCELFDTWYESDTRLVSIRGFDAILSRKVENRSVLCTMGRVCNQYFVVEHNGDVYPCDFFVEKKHLLGNLMHAGWDTVRVSGELDAFASKKGKCNSACRSCRWLSLCAGDCLKHRLVATDDPRTLSLLCPGWQSFYSHTDQRFEQLAVEIRREREGGSPAAYAGPGGLPAGLAAQTPVARNALCPCGSGRKFKKCCMPGA